MGLKRELPFAICLFLAAAIALAFMGGACAFDGSSPPTGGINESTITVTGTGSVYSAPDMARFSAGVLTDSNSSSDAMAKNAELMNAVVSAIKKAGIPDKDIQTSRVSVDPVYNYTDKPKIVGYKAMNTVTVTVRDLSKVGPSIDAAYGAGANDIAGVIFRLSDAKAADVYRQALTKAVNDGSDKAKTIATAANVGNITLKSVSESGGRVQPREHFAGGMGAEVKAAAAPVPVSPGEQKVQAIVDMIYKIGK